ncbi:MAG: glycosyltransferase family 4 protein [Acidimicrobiia bacterium]|nr:glycosyltransferase family 4 protein [Acidimicrobiia bacterium]
MVRTMGKGAVPEPGRLRLFYVVGTYPLLTTTFIDREIEMLSEWEVDVAVIAMRRPDPTTPFTSRQEALAARTTYLLPARKTTVLASHLYFAIRRPIRFWTTLLWLLTRPHPTLASRQKTLLHFGEGVLASYLVRHREFEEFHAHFADRAATVALVGGRLVGKPYSLSIHTGADIYVDSVLLAEKIQRARAVTTCTSYNRDHLGELLDRSHRPEIYHVRHGLDLSTYSPGMVSDGTPSTILSVGQLKPRKGFAQLIRACAVLKQRGYDFQCRIIGEGPERPVLESLIADLDISDVVELAGPRSQDDVLDEYRSATLFALPCVQTREGDVDGIPNVLAEAMAVELPVVSTDLPAITELVTPEVSGLLTAPDALDALADALARLLDDPPLRSRLGAAARAAVVETFDLETNVRRFADNLWPGRIRVEVGA